MPSAWHRLLWQARDHESHCSDEAGVCFSKDVLEPMEEVASLDSYCSFIIHASLVHLILQRLQTQNSQPRSSPLEARISYQEAGKPVARMHASSLSGAAERNKSSSRKIAYPSIAWWARAERCSNVRCISRPAAMPAGLCCSY